MAYDGWLVVVRPAAPCAVPPFAQFAAKVGFPPLTDCPPKVAHAHGDVAGGFLDAGARMFYRCGMFKPWGPCLLSLALATPAGAHPHVFVDTDLTLVLNEARELTGVDVTWTYDDFFTLLILEDMGLDPDGDGVLTEAELAQLKGFDLVEWPPGFEGDLYVHEGGEKIEMPRPTPTGIAVENGRIVATHHRAVPEVPAEDLVLEQYDPTYYVAYTLRDVTVEGPCRTQIAEPQPTEAEQALAQELSKVPEDMFQVMEVGVYYAAELRLSCEAPS